MFLPTMDQGFGMPQGILKLYDSRKTWRTITNPMVISRHLVMLIHNLFHMNHEKTMWCGGKINKLHDSNFTARSLGISLQIGLQYMFWWIPKGLKPTSARRSCSTCGVEPPTPVKCKPRCSMEIWGNVKLVDLFDLLRKVGLDFRKNSSRNISIFTGNEKVSVITGFKVPEYSIREVIAIPFQPDKQTYGYSNPMRIAHRYS